MYKIKRFLKTSVIFFVGNVLSKLVNLFLLPLYTNRLTPAQFGGYDLNITILNLLIPIIFFQIWDGMYRYGFEKKELNEKYSVISNSYLTWFISLIFYLFIFLIIRNSITLQDSVYVFLYGFMMAANNQYFYLTRVFLKNNLFVISGIINSVMVAVSNIVLITIFNFGVKSLYISSIGGSLIQILIIELFLHPIKSFRIKDISKSNIFQMLKFTIPLSFTTVSYWFLEGYTKISISIHLGTFSNGLYAVANRFSSIMTLFITIVQYAWNEMAYIIANETDSIYKYEIGISYIFKIAVISSSAFMLVIKIVFPLFINEAYRDAMYLIPFSLIGITANAYSNFLSILFLAEKQTKWLFLTTMVVAVMNVAIQLAFPSFLALQGFVILLCLSFMLLALLRIYTMKKALKINFSKLNYLYIFALLISVIIYYYIDSSIVAVLYIVLLGFALLYTLRDLVKLTLNKKKLTGKIQKRVSKDANSQNPYSYRL